MPDREDVISLVEDAIEVVEKEAFWTIANGLRDVIAMLKEQEAVKPMLITWDHPLKGVAYVCPNCKKEARDYWKYCPFCGKAIDWEGR